MENTMRIRGQLYEIPDEYMKQAELNGVSRQRVYERLVRNKGWTIKEACFAPEGMKLAEYRHLVRELEREERHKNAYGNLLEEKQQSERPWLYDGTPQKHERSKWCEYLMKTSIYPKAVR
ncbi:SA1788 family PVL leukocidin-associated protein [Staphylococcus nepalensis]|uniref:SA1788 family PVL leukocidin-associated protein n=1 Tax=Staphylococcus nepalensis TaxID=214473 RepID=UPI00383B2D24